MATRWVTVSPPSGFTMTTPFTIQRNEYGQFRVKAGWSMVDVIPRLEYHMYVSPSGSDSNNGSTLALAKKTIENAIGSLIAPTNIWLDDGLYGENPGTGEGGHWRGAVPQYNIAMRAINSGRVINSPHVYQLSWSVYSGVTYQATYASTVQSVWDESVLANYQQDYTQVTAETSIANVVANAGTWYQTGGVIYLHLFDGRVPDDDLHVFREIQSAYCVKDSITIYIEGIEFQGGPNGACYFRNNSSEGGLNVYAKDCQFKYSAATGGLATEGATLSIAQNCVSSANQNDGFNYHVRNGVIPDAIEIDCTGRHNGTNGDNDNNGSSIHDAGRVIRINGQYYNNYGPHVADVNDSLSWNMGCVAHTGLAATTSNYSITGKMWLDACRSYKHATSGYDINVVGASSEFYYHELASDAAYSNAGTMAAYNPTLSESYWYTRRSWTAVRGRR